MYILRAYLLLSTIKAIVITEIHRSSVYSPFSSCAFLRNVSWFADESIQSCMWECVVDDDCQTAVYFDDRKICSIFAESCHTDSIQSSGSDRASVICARKSQRPAITCSSVVTPNQVETDTTTVSTIMTSTRQIAFSIDTTAAHSSSRSTSVTSSTTTATTTITTQLPSITGGSIREDVWISSTYSYWAAASTNLTITFSFQTKEYYQWYLDDVSVRLWASTEMLQNGDFESSPSLTGWTIGFSNSCTNSTSLSTRKSHSSQHAYCQTCVGQITWIYQSFEAILGQFYYITYWYYLDRQGPPNGNGTNQLNVTMS